MNLRDPIGVLFERATAVLLCSVAFAAQAAPSMPDAVRRVFEQGTANGAYASVAVGLIEGGEQRTWVFGKSAAGTDAAYEIGALTDVFTGTLFAQAILDGKVRINQPLADLLPEARTQPDSVIAKVPLVALATQRSGLPATPANLFPEREDDPYAGYGDADLRQWFADQSAAAGAAPGTYSVLNAGLLGLALARAYGEEFRALLGKKVLAPLGLKHTGFDDPTTLLSGNSFGRPAAHWHFAALAGAAGLRSTLGDLLTFLRANLGPDGSPLASALLLARQGRASTPTGSIGLGWNVGEVTMQDQTWPLVWRASETGGFSAFVGFRTDRQQAVVLLSNSAAELAPIGLAWLTDKSIPAAPSTPYRVDAEHLRRYPGLYRLLNGSELTVSVDGDRLGAQLRGEPPWSMLQPVAEDVFAVPGGALDLTFVRNIDAISGVLLHVNGEFVNGQRLSARAPRLQRPVLAMPPAALAEYRGDYIVNPDLMLRISVRADGLALQFTGMSPLPMHAFAKDRFTTADGRNAIAFVRDAAQRITAATLDLSGAERRAQLVVRPARFERPSTAANGVQP